MSVELQYALTKDDLFEYSHFVEYSDPRKKEKSKSFGWKHTLAFVIPILIVTIITKLIYPEIKLSMYIILFLVLIYIVLIISELYLKIYLKKATNKFASDPMNENFFKVNLYRFSSSGILVSGEHGTSEMKWDTITRRAETQHAYYLFITSLQALVIPKKHIEHLKKEKLEAIFNENLPFVADIPIAAKI